MNGIGARIRSMRGGRTRARLMRSGPPVPRVGAGGAAVKEHPRHRQLVALLIAAFFLAMTILAAGFSLLQDQPTPARTRPLPVVIPLQGAVR